jgi:hypothetical protein
MAHFFNPLRPYDEHYKEGHGAEAALRGELKIGLWVGDPALTNQFVVKPNNPSLLAIRDRAIPGRACRHKCAMRGGKNQSKSGVAKPHRIFGRLGEEP